MNEQEPTSNTFSTAARDRTDYNASKEWISYPEVVKRAQFRSGYRPYDVRKVLLKATCILGIKPKVRQEQEIWASVLPDASKEAKAPKSEIGVWSAYSDIGFDWNDYHIKVVTIEGNQQDYDIDDNEDFLHDEDDWEQTDWPFDLIAEIWPIAESYPTVDYLGRPVPSAAEAPARLPQQQEKPRSRGGRPPEYPWEDIAVEVGAWLEVNGQPSRISDLDDFIVSRLALRSTATPAESTVRERRQKFLSAFQRWRRAN